MRAKKFTSPAVASDTDCGLFDMAFFLVYNPDIPGEVCTLNPDGTLDRDFFRQDDWDNLEGGLDEIIKFKKPITVSPDEMALVLSKEMERTFHSICGDGRFFYTGGLREQHTKTGHTILIGQKPDLLLWRNRQTEEMMGFLDSIVQNPHNKEPEQAKRMERLCRNVMLFAGLSRMDLYLRAVAHVCFYTACTDQDRAKLTWEMMLGQIVGAKNENN